MKVPQQEQKLVNKTPHLFDNTEAFKKPNAVQTPSKSAVVQNANKQQISSGHTTYLSQHNELHTDVTIPKQHSNVLPTHSRTLKKKNVGADNQEKVSYAYRLGGETFVYLLNAENGQWTFKRKHPKVKGTIGTDHGFCGINDHYHPQIVKDHRFRTDWKWQMRECYRLYKGGTTFYGAKNIAKQKHFFTYK